MREIFDEMRRFLLQGEDATLTTIVRTAGSTYRREGAKMLIAQKGEFVGSVSGGCLEGDIYEQSLKVLGKREPLLVTYDTRAEDDSVWGLGLGCNGAVEVLIEPIDWWAGEGSEGLLSTVSERLDWSEKVAVITLLRKDTQPVKGRLLRLVVFSDGSTVGGLGSTELDKQAAREAAKLLGDGRSRLVSLQVRREGREENYEVYVDTICPPLDLVVFGAGHDAIPVVRLARSLQMRVRVVDSRPQFTTKERFPEADEVILADPDQVAERVPIGPNSYVVIMTHNFSYDLEFLAQVLPLCPCYLGVLGPKARTRRMLEELQKRGITVTAEQASTLHTPVGLDIGADSPEEIACSLLAEILASKNRQAGGSLVAKGESLLQAA